MLIELLLCFHAEIQVYKKYKHYVLCQPIHKLIYALQQFHLLMRVKMVCVFQLRNLFYRYSLSPPPFRLSFHLCVALYNARVSPFPVGSSVERALRGGLVCEAPRVSRK